MALFKFRKGRDEQPATVGNAPTVEAVRRRAMHRLIGAAVLVLAGVIGFPLVFDNQPRPIPVDLPIDIVDKSKARPLTPPQPVGVPVTASGPPPAQPAAAKGAVQEPEPARSAQPVALAPAAPAPASAATSPVPAQTPAAAGAAPGATAPAGALAQDARRAQALLEARPVPAASPAQAAPAAAAGAGNAAAVSSARFVVQVGAFSDAAKVREVRRKVEASGLKTYTQVVTTADGDRTRVRVGPFADRAEADKAAARIRKLDLSAAILTL